MNCIDKRNDSFIPTPEAHGRLHNAGGAVRLISNVVQCALEDDKQQDPEARVAATGFLCYNFASS